MPTDLPLELGALALSYGIAGLAFVSRRWPTAPTGEQPPAATFQPVPDGAVWRPCATTSCAHLTTRHVPAGDGRRCSDCDHFTLIPLDELPVRPPSIPGPRTA